MRALIIAVPVVAGFGVAWWLAGVLPPASNVAQLIATWLVLIAASSAAIWLLERLARQFLPLAFLLELSLLFPGRAPSRFRVALQARGTRDLRAHLEHGEDDAGGAAATILSLITAISAHDRRTRGHSERVRAYAELLGEELGVTGDDIEKLRWAALLHDVGKLRVPGAVLNKSREPDDHEWHIIRQHPIEGARLAGPLLRWLGPWGRAIEQHHEHYDGTGYPYGLRGEEISLGARIVAVADAYETMTAVRSYNRPMSPARAREELARCGGTHFDPHVVRAFLNLSTARLRRVAGPLVWVAELPLLAPLRGVAAQPAAATSAVASVAAVAALTGVAASPATTAAVADEPLPPPVVVHGDRGVLAPADDRDDAPIRAEDRSAEAGSAASTATPTPTSETVTSDDGRAVVVEAPEDDTVAPAGDPQPAGEPTADSAETTSSEPPPDPPDHANADPDPAREPGTPADPDPHGEDGEEPGRDREARDRG